MFGKIIIIRLFVGINKNRIVIIINYKRINSLGEFRKLLRNIRKIRRVKFGVCILSN